MKYSGLVFPDPSLGEVCTFFELPQIAGNPTVYTPPGGGVPRVFARGTSNNLLEFIPDNAGGRVWNAYDHTVDTGVPISGDPAVFAGSLRVYVRGTSNNLLEFIPDNLHGRIWNAYDHTVDTGVPISGDPAVFAGSLQVYVQGTSSNLLEFIPDNMGGRIWNAYNHGPQPALVIDQSLYALPPTGQLVVADPTPDPSAEVLIQWVTSSLDTFTEWRLVQGLRTSAAFPGRSFDQQLPVSPPPADWDGRNPVATLTNAAALLARSPVQAMAMADLAVTGRMSYEALAAMSFRTPADVVARLVSDGADQAAATQVVARAQKVAWAIRGNPSWRATLRPQLGWIGISGEDDVPHRPCNVSSLPGPQFDIEVRDVPVTFGTLTVTTRIVIAEDPWPTPTTTMPGTPPSFLPPDDAPAISPDSDYVFLYMAGDCSCAEEARDMIPALLAAAQEHGKRASVIAFDMVGWGYSARKVFDGAGNPVLFDQASTFANGQPLFPLVTYPANPPALQFVEDFTVALMQTLSQQAPHLDLTKVVPIGGSLGGNLALRLGRRTDLKWLTAVCGWSPASVWSSYTGSATGRDAIGQCSDRMKILEDQPDDLKTAAAGSRRIHFSQVFDQDTLSVVVQVLPPQADMWYRGYDWEGCKELSICYDRLDRRETYDPTFRRWHWRISQDQLVYSHRDPDPATGVPRYLLNTIPMLLAAGANDDYPGVGICSNTQDLAQKMTNCPGTSLFLNDTGHSIHNERPKELSRAIFDFLHTLGQINVLPGSLSFGDVTINVSTISDVVITNATLMTLPVTWTLKQGGSDFSVSPPPSGNLAPGQSVTAHVTVIATGAGPISNQLVISSTAREWSQAVPLSATGVSSPADLVWVDASGTVIGGATEVIFTQPLGTTSGIVRLRNIGSSPADITHLGWSQPDPNLFSYTGISDGSDGKPATRIQPAEILTVTIGLRQRNIGTSTLTVQAQGEGAGNSMSVKVLADSNIIRPPGL
jgi:pimeloyl-ACP methyl ester carboxylesterase